MRGGSTPRRYLTLMIVPDRGQESHTFRLSYAVLRALAGLFAFGALALTLVAGSWWYLAARASRVTHLEAEVHSLQLERERIADLVRQLESIEVQYGRIRALFAPTVAAPPSDAWLPPPLGGRRGPTSRGSVNESLPTAWPLSERGFVTQGLLEGSGRVGTDHPGLDIAVPTDSYVRAAGSGTVVDLGDDPVYGRFVVLDHGGGYTTIYGHASLLLVERGQRVRRREVIALSGSTGQSTAPHLHFEILLNGEAVDPLTLIQQP